ncbi:nucleotidyl transferase AbiEii/AbiGii toxin family protein [Kribbella italica]|uniref:Putative nucleotidyltransferase component of viral defense system n=1 Tax=Kribbella italica TaxID=1540520 RepID=A0A7W9J9U1_9ACTN|nr:nucleotidyl transferase AbiEii/AbiGii toxin family protein [Kribbella italica]MBB5838256.1 putative nucleotidyltransferase component of viral defense system [Kribbella italica]
MAEPLTLLEASRLRVALGARLANEARSRGVAADPVRKQYIFTIFLSRLFQDQDAPWVLLGGNALLIRIGSGRFTQDIDLARQTAWDSAEAALSELRLLSSRPHRGDPFEFDLHSLTTNREPDAYGYGAETAKVKARALLGGQVFETFSIDLTTRRHVDAPVDQVALKPIIEHETLQDLPSVPTVPIENHLADKICALYERHGQSGDKASSRYRDLADIVRIVSAVPFDAARLVTVLQRETGRRQMSLPRSVEVPGEEWGVDFPRAAAEFAEYSREYWDLNAALSFCGACLDEVLNGDRASGTWDPDRNSWQ